MGNSEGNTVVESDRLSSQSSSSWKVLDENSIYSDERRRPIMYPNFTNGEAKLTPKMCTTVRGNVIAIHADVYSKANANGTDVVPVDLRKEKIDSKKSEVCAEKQTENEKTQNDGLKENSTAKLKFGIDNILAQSSTSKSPRKDSLSDNLCFGKTCGKSDKTSIKRSLSRNSSNDDSAKLDRDGLPRNQTSPGHHHMKRFNGYYGEQCQQHLLNHQQKISAGQARKHSHPIQYHPYRSKKDSNISRNFPRLTSNIDTLKHHDDRCRRRSESPNQKLLLETSFSSIPKSPIARLNNYSSGEKMRNLRQSSDPNPGKFRPLSPIYKSAATINLEPRSKSLNSSPFDSCAKTAASEKSNSPRSSGSPFFESFKGTISDHISYGIRKRIHSETDEVFDDASNKQLPFRHDGPTVWKHRHFSTQEEHVADTKSPEFLPFSKQCKQGATSFFPMMSGHNTPSFTPPITPPNFNLQSWQQAMASNCHPSFRHLVFPYAFGHSAAVAMATAMRQSFKSLTSPGLMLNDSFPRQKSPSKSGFNIQDTRSNQHSFSDKASSGPRKRRKWSRAVFSLMQRRGLEKSFQAQKYVAKPERRGLAEALGLTDAQVKIWFQNRRMKWRQEQKSSNKLNAESEDLSPTSGEEHFNQINLQ